MGCGSSAAAPAVLVPNKPPVITVKRASVRCKEPQENTVEVRIWFVYYGRGSSAILAKKVYTASIPARPHDTIYCSDISNAVAQIAHALWPGRKEVDKLIIVRRRPPNSSEAEEQHTITTELKQTVPARSPTLLADRLVLSPPLWSLVTLTASSYCSASSLWTSGSLVLEVEAVLATRLDETTTTMTQSHR